MVNGKLHRVYRSLPGAICGSESGAAVQRGADEILRVPECGVGIAKLRGLPAADERPRAASRGVNLAERCLDAILHSDPQTVSDAELIAALRLAGVEAFIPVTPDFRRSGIPVRGYPN